VEIQTAALPKLRPLGFRIDIVGKPHRNTGTGRIAVALLGAAAYASLAGIAIGRSWHHHELIGIFLQYALLLPAVVYGLRTPGTTTTVCMPRRLAATLIFAFLAISSAVSWRVSQGMTISDEGSYRFEALTLASGRMVAPPPAGAPERPADVPQPLGFNHQILSRTGWYSKYPLGWPAVLAFPERINLGWLVNPILGAILLAIIGLVAREAFGPATVLPAVAMAALSPYFLANSVGRMSHALAGVLVAAAALFCIRGLKTGKVSRFACMFLLLGATFHARPFTAFVASAVLGLGALVGTRGRRSLCTRVSLLGALAASFAVSSFLLYNWRFTGHPFLSPYAVYRGVAIPTEVMATGPQVLRNLELTWRFALQSTVLYSFPFLAPLLIYGFWALRPKSPVPWILLALPCALGLAHLVQFEGSSSVIGERYWFEGYFAIAVLAAEGLRRLLAAWRSGRRPAIAVAIGLAAAQLVVMAAAAARLDAASRPDREVRRLAEAYQGCGCVVYFADNPQVFFGKRLNLNGPAWPSAGVFYAVDPGPDERAMWARILHSRRWVVLTYDAQRSVAKIVETGE
jgi:hypothetical protein